LYLSSAFPKLGPAGAYDEASSSEKATADLLLFLKSKLSDDDFTEFCRLGGYDAGMIAEDADTDQPPAFPGRPKRDGGLGEDAARHSPGGLSGKTLAHLMSIKVNPA
jgi:hypothetical protein